MQALLAALQKNWRNEYFQKLCVALESTNPWLMDELTIELEAERGKQVVTDTIQLENGRIVIKEFGHETRLSEFEKRRLLALLNRNSQCTKDIWERLERLYTPRLQRLYRNTLIIVCKDTSLLRLCTCLYKHCPI